MFNFLKLSTKPQSETAVATTTSTITLDETSKEIPEVSEDATITSNIDETNTSDKPDIAIENVITNDAESTTENTLSNEPVAESLSPTSTIEEYLHAHSFEIDYSRVGEYVLISDSVKDVAEYIFEHHENISDFLGFLRIKLSKDGFVSYSMERLSSEAKEATIKFAKDILTPHGLLANTYVNYNANLITANIPGAKRVHSFIAGGWLEIIARQIVEDIVSKRAKEFCVDYQVLSNLMVSKDGKLHELDVVFKLANGRMCWIECKSSHKYCDYETFYKVGVDMSTIPTYTMLLYPGEDKYVSSICYYYEIYCCNLNKTRLISQITDMLNKSINN